MKAKCSYVTFDDAVADVSAGNLKTPKQAYLRSGKYPVIDQGQEPVGGYTDDRTFLVQGRAPWVVFGDHTRAIKYLDFSFCMGADGVKVLQPRDPHRLDTKYLYYFLKSNEIPSAGYSRHFKFLRRLSIPLPPLDEQRRIAAILDNADALRRKRKRALDLFDDDLTRAIYQDIFGGAASRSTVKKIGSVCFVGSGSTPKRENPGNYGGDIRWVKTTEVKGHVIRDTEEKITEVGRSNARLRVYPKGTVLIAMYGQGTTRGHVGLLGVEATTNQACAAIRTGPELDPTFLFYQLKQNYENLRALGRGGNQPNLNADLVKNFEVLVPPMEQQSYFVDIMTVASRQHDRLSLAVKAWEETFQALQSRAFSGQL